MIGDTVKGNPKNVPGMYLYHTEAGITHLRFVRNDREHHETCDAFRATFKTLPRGKAS